jgi:hypothetical protein
MVRTVRQIVFLGALAGALVLLAPVIKSSGVAWAQLQGNFNTSYFDTRAGGNTVKIINPETHSGGFLCAMTYVFRSDEQLDECCGCPVTDEGLRTIAVAKEPFTKDPLVTNQCQASGTQASRLPTINDLTSNPEHGIPNVRGVIKIVSTLPNDSAVPCQSTGGPVPTCNPALSWTTAPTLREYITHTQIPEFNQTEVAGTGSFDDTSATSNDTFPGPAATETQFQEAPLDTAEADKLVTLCRNIHLNGSGLGICGCGSGDEFPHKVGAAH